MIMNKVSFVIIMVGLLLGALALRGANASNSSMAVRAKYKGTSGENYFSLEFIRDGASEKEKYLLRNNHYIFTITNYTAAGYTTEAEAITATPMNVKEFHSYK